MDDQPPKLFKQMPGVVQVVMAVWDDERGLITTRHGLIYGGHHGPAPMIDKPDEAEAILSLQMRSQLRALEKRWSDE